LSLLFAYLRRAKNIKEQITAYNRMKNETINVLLVKLGFLFGALYAFSISLKLYFIGIFYYAVGAFLMVSLFILQVVMIIIYSGDKKPLRHLILYFLIISVIVNYFLSVPQRYGTDSIIMSHMGAALTLEGKNPYLEPLLPWVKKFQLPLNWMTPKMDGTFINYITYPSINFLIFVPFMALGVKNLVQIVFIFYLFSIIFLYITSRNHPLNPIIVFPLIIYELPFFDFVVGSVTDFVWIFFMMIALYMATKDKLVFSSIFLALSAGFKQIAIMAVPFLIIRLLNRHKLKNIVRYFLTPLAIAFILPNLPYLIWDPYSWIKAVLAPIISLDAPMIPHGFGLIRLMLSNEIPIPHSAYMFLSIGFLLISIYLYLIKSENKELCWILIIINFLFWWRSFPNYFISWIPILLLDLTLPAHKLKMNRHTMEKIKKVGIALLITGIALIIFSVWIASSESYSYSIEIKEIRYINSTLLRITIINNSNRTISPIFGILKEGAYTWNIIYWNMSQSFEPINPGEEREFLLVSPLSQVRLIKGDRIMVFINDKHEFNHYYVKIIEVN
ncbi:MAG: hypothetical protein ACTSYF_01420, partial [Promethearchaeota archaeon]